MQNKSYKDFFGISQSILKSFRFKSPKKWKTIYIDKQIEFEKDDDYLVFGSLVDTLLFNPELLNDRFYIADVSKIPKGGIEKVISRVYSSYKASIEGDLEQRVPDIKKVTFIEDENFPEPLVKTDYDLSLLKTTILEACKEEEWQSRWKDDTKVNKIINEGGEYFGLLEEAGGREIITTEVNLEAITAVNVLKNDESSRKYFTESSRYKYIYQLEIFTHYTSTSGYKLPLKGAIDIFFIDYELRTVQVVDFKTTYSAFDFLKSIKQYSYADQLSFYNDLVDYKMKEDKEWVKELGIEGFKRLEPINVVIDKEEKVPYIYEYNWEDLDRSKLGNELLVLENGIICPQKIKKGWQQLLEEIAWHMENNKWVYSYDYYKNGKVKVNLLNS